MFLLDTNVVSDLRRADRASACLRGWAWSAFAKMQFISCITVFELEFGVRLHERHAPAQGALLRRRLEQHVLPQFKRRLQVDTTAARRGAELHAPKPKPGQDSSIAATALVHGLAVVTRNTRNFIDCGAPVLNPWEATA